MSGRGSLMELDSYPVARDAMELAEKMVCETNGTSWPWPHNWIWKHEYESGGSYGTAPVSLGA